MKIDPSRIAATLLGMAAPAFVAPAVAQAPYASTPESNLGGIAIDAGDGHKHASPVEEKTPAVGIVIEEIIVTAQRREQAINDIPIAISAFSGADMRALGVTDTRDLAKIVPGFTAADSGGNTPVYTLRGIGFNDQTYTATSTVGVYVDEVPLPYSIMTKGANLDLQRVEVLKGPQGTLYGRNTTGGAINYIANKPTDQFEAGVAAGYARFQTTELEGFVSGPLTDTLKARLAVRDQRSGQGWQTSNTRADSLGRVDKQAVRGLLDWNPVDDLTVEFALSAWRDGSDPQAPQAIYRQPQNPQIGALALAPQVRAYPLVDPDTDDVRVADWDPDTDWQLHDRYWQFSARADYFLNGETTLTAIYSHGDMRSDGSVIPQSGFDFYNAEQELFASVKTDSIETRVAGKFGDRINWLAGINAAFDDGSELHRLFTDTVSSLYPDPITGNSLLANRVSTYGENRAQTYGLFGNADWQFTDTLQFTLGARYSTETRKFRGCTFEDPESRGAGLAPLIVAAALLRGNVLLIQKGECFTLDASGHNDVFQGKLDEDSLSYRSAVNWTPEDGQLYYVSYTRGYKSGGFPVLNASDQVQYEPVKQEKLQATEVGGKVAFWQRRAHLNFALFDYDYRNKQLLTRRFDPLFGPTPVLRNAPKSKVQGAEADLQVSPYNGLLLTLSGSYIDSEIREFIGQGFNGEDVDFSGKPFNFAPRLQYTGLVDYEFPIGSEQLLMGMSADYSYTDKTNSTLEGNPDYAHRDFGLVNARLRLSDAGRIWTFTLWGRNLTDEFSQVSIFNIGDAVARYAGMPRTYGASLIYRFE